MTNFLLLAMLVNLVLIGWDVEKIRKALTKP